MEEVVICIPVYQESINSSQAISFRQCFKVLNFYPICLICPEHLCINAYTTIADEFGKKVKIERFNSAYFNDIASYNMLMLSPDFYKRFTKYEFLLIYQTDAYVFKDELHYWCVQNYDYIGAPWFEGFSKAGENANLFGVGNGGFSLRKVKSFLKVLNSFSYITPPRDLWLSFKTTISGRSFLQLVKDLTIQNNSFYRFNNFSEQEDFFWGSFVPNRFKWFKIPGIHIALKFSMEVNAPLLFRLNNSNLPFGCHAWEKYNPEFWTRFIEGPMEK